MLGYSDPLVLTTEYFVRYGLGQWDYKVPDYALHPSGQEDGPSGFVEAKRLGADLNDVHRKQLFDATKYARNNGLDIQFCVLTNGDRWDLMTPSKGSYKPVFSISLSKSSAAECAQILWDHFPRPPGYEIENDSNRPPTLVYDPHIKSSVADFALKRVRNTSVDLHKVLAHFAFYFIAFICTGWFAGFALHPAISFSLSYTIVGFIGFGFLGILVAGVIVHALFQYPKSKIDDAWRLAALRGPIAGRRLATWFWIGVAMIVGVGAGGGAGYALGYAYTTFIDAGSWWLRIVLMLGLAAVPVLYTAAVNLSRNKK